MTFERNLAIYNLRKDGAKFTDIARQYGFGTPVAARNIYLRVKSSIEDPVKQRQRITMLEAFGYTVTEKRR